jgi:7-cyano-7-deazaguanine synthase
MGKDEGQGEVSMDTAVLLSGGLDSAVLLANAVEKGNGVIAISVNYGQRHAKELEYARRIAAHYKVEHEVIDLRTLGGHLRSALTSGGGTVPQGHYQAESMKATVVPNRNMILLAVAAGVASSVGASRLGYACHAGDHAIYPDCRPAFVQAMWTTLLCSMERRMELWTPFLEWTKGEIVMHGHVLEVPFDLTWSCYEGGEFHCGECGTCVERREAFELPHITDPTAYRAGAHHV